MSDTIYPLFRHFFRIILSLMRGPQPEKPPEKPTSEETTSIMLRRPPPAPALTAPTSEAGESAAGTIAIMPPADGAAKDDPAHEGSSAGAAVEDGSSGGTPAGEGEKANGIVEGASMLASTLLADPAEEAAKAAAAAEVQAQQEATMAALEAVASAKPQTDASHESHVHSLFPFYIFSLTFDFFFQINEWLSFFFGVGGVGQRWRVCEKDCQFLGAQLLQPKISRPRTGFLYQLHVALL